MLGIVFAEVCSRLSFYKETKEYAGLKKSYLGKTLSLAPGRLVFVARLYTLPLQFKVLTYFTAAEKWQMVCYLRK